MGNLLRSCAEVRERMELSFGLVSGAGLGIRVFDGGPRAKGEGAVSGVFCHETIPLV